MTSNHRRIFLVDDDTDDLEILQEVLMELEPAIVVVTVSSGRQAVDLLLNYTDRELPDLIVVDFNMPDITGAELLSILCREKRYEMVPKVVWSTSDASLYENICKRSGATHYFRKPDTIDGIEVLARQLLLLNL